MDAERLDRILEQARRAASEGIAGALDAVEQALSNLHIPVPPETPAPPAPPTLIYPLEASIPCSNRARPAITIAERPAWISSEDSPFNRRLW